MSQSLNYLSSFAYTNSTLCFAIICKPIKNHEQLTFLWIITNKNTGFEIIYVRNIHTFKSIHLVFECINLICKLNINSNGTFYMTFSCSKIQLKIKRQLIILYNFQLKRRQKSLTRLSYARSHVTPIPNNHVVLLLNSIKALYFIFAYLMFICKKKRLKQKTAFINSIGYSLK